MTTLKVLMDVKYPSVHGINPSVHFKPTISDLNYNHSLIGCNTCVQTKLNSAGIMKILLPFIELTNSAFLD